MCASDGEDCSVPPEGVPALMKSLDIIGIVAKITSIFAWTRARLCGGARSVPMSAECRVSQDLELALGAVMQLLRDADAMLEEGVDAQVSAIAGLPWLFPLGQFTEWKVLAKLVAEEVCRTALTTCVGQMHDEAEVLVKVVPTWNHLTNGPKINLELASKHLVRWPSKAKMNSGAVRLEKALAHVSLLYATWGFCGKVEDDENYGKQMAHIMPIYDTAKRAILLTAIVNLLHGVPPSKERNDKAMALKAKAESWLPACVGKEIDKLR